MSKQKTTNYTPGSEYSYSNSNYTALVTIVERVSGQSLAEFTRTSFFEPLGMTHTKWRDNFHEIIANRAIAYVKAGSGYEQLMPFENVHGHGGLLTTAADLAKWNSLLETKKIGGDKVYQWRVQTGKLTNGQSITYASGLVVDQLNNFTQISHSGATAGYRAWLAYYPQKKLTVTLLSNDGSLNVSNVGQQIAEVFLGKKSVTNNERKEITLAEAELKRFDGIYRSVRHYDVQKLEYKDGKIISNERALQAAHRDTLYLGGMKWIATKKPNVILIQNGSDTLSYQKVLPSDISAKSLAPLAGDYYSAEADATYSIEIRNDEVWSQIKPFAAEKLEPSFKDGFNLYGTLYEFQRDKKGKVSGLLVSTSRAERIPFLKK